MGIVQVIIDRTTSMNIEGVYLFDRPEGGTLIAPSGNSFPPAPVAGEWLWLTTTNVLYRRDDSNTTWVEVGGNPDPVTTPFSFVATCLSSDVVGGAVYISGDAIDGVPRVTAADPTVPDKMPSIGMILSKSSATNCVVAYFGAVPVTGLTPNARYYVGIGGAVVPHVPSNRPFIVQVLGQALDSGRLLLTPSKTVLRLNS